MKISVKIFKPFKVIEKTVEGDSIIATIDKTISEIGGKKYKFRVFGERNHDGKFEYLIIKGKKKVGVLREIS